MRHVSGHERRSRLAIRHGLAPGFRLATPEAVTDALAVLHATDPATVYLSCWARIDDLAVDEVDRALYRDRSLIKQLAMRRTLFVFPTDLLTAAWGSASARVAGFERARMAKDVELAGLVEDDQDGNAWLDAARADVLRFMAEQPDGRLATEIRQGVPRIDVKLTVSPGAPWSAPRVLTHLGLTGDLVRAENTGHWRTSRPRWTLMRHWLPPSELPDASVPPGPPGPPGPLPAAVGWRELIRRWLARFGPGTEDDIVWWLGATKAVVRTALAELEAVQVSLERDEAGWLLPDDLDEPEVSPDPWVALLPVLDPTVMGWRGRDFYLGPHRDQLFDRNGNAGTTVWVDGRVVGCWVQDDDAVVRLRLLEPVPTKVRRQLDREAARLTDWLGGVRVGLVLPVPAMRAPGRPG